MLRTLGGHCPERILDSGSETMIRGAAAFGEPERGRCCPMCIGARRRAGGALGKLRGQSRSSATFGHLALTIPRSLNSYLVFRDGDYPFCD